MGQPVDIQCVIFDLGGVLIELDGPPVSPHKTNLSEAAIWERWLRSNAVRKFESGACDHHEFADQLIDEFGLEIPKHQLLEDFEQWPIGFFPESEAMIQTLVGKTKLACLSNTNDLHWRRFKSESPIYDQMDHLFFSFEMGLMKPDPEIFESVQTELDIPPYQLLFLDDNQMNVDAARARGWHSEATRGPSEVAACLKQYHLL